MMRKKWLVKDAPNPLDVSRLKEEMNVSEIVAHMLIQRGIKDFNSARTFFRGNLDEMHDPFLMKNMQVAVVRLQQAGNPWDF